MQCLNATVINENKSLTVNVDKMSQYMATQACNLLRHCLIAVSIINYVLIKMLPFVHDALTQLFNVLHIVLYTLYCMIPNIIALKIINI